MSYESVVQITIIVCIGIVHVAYILCCMSIQCVKYGSYVFYMLSTIYLSAYSVCCACRMCSVLCMVYFFWVCIMCVACVLYVVCVAGGPGNGHNWLFAWQTLIRWKKEYHFSIKDSGYTVPGGWPVSWRPICVYLLAFGIIQREAALVWQTGVDLSCATNYPHPCSWAWAFSYVFSMLTSPLTMQVLLYPVGCVLCVHTLQKVGILSDLFPSYSSNTRTMLDMDHMCNENVWWWIYLI